MSFRRTAAVIVTGLLVLWQAGFDFGSFISILPSLPSWWPAALGWSVIIALAVIVALMAAVAEELASDESATTQYAGSFAALTQAVGLMLIGYVVWVSWDSVTAVVRNLWFIGPLLVLGWFGYVYAQHRRNVATTSTAVRRTRRTADREIEGYAELAVGSVVLVLAAVFAVFSGALSALSGMGDVLLPFAPEFSYLFSVLLGYVSLGGSVPFDWIVPDLTPAQYAAITLVAGGIAIMVKES